MIVFDTNVISEILKEDSSDPHVIDWFIGLPHRECRTTAITVAELMYGVAIAPKGKKRARLSGAIQAFTRTYADRTLPFDQQSAAHYASIAAARRRMGRPIGTQDAMIAAIARAHGAAVATRNIKDFEGTGVALVNPWEHDRR
ncbi:type II toxin-antitoxin system VapC family toxin [Bifidobacterium saguinibicoloris]|uniref:type II toxin-antitoxin system VapC family toxin n=1 Tax=Bifidobacterium saguinibicoloris TaxID=2834433 RepID=UPI001C59C31C|nr:type II toxin-antitoxin system VapC family toxin [Bifidobacterium saguinibicoloris]MBW3080218.1 type II toxin-antitoxin system VapC family toxin [Bifidobacterium saguinibicoloris]